MSDELTIDDYKKILEFYKIKVPKSKRLLKVGAEKILADKLCACIKKVSPLGTESRAIRICTKSVINRKNITRGSFTCKGNRKIKIKALVKTKRRISN